MLGSSLSSLCMHLFSVTIEQIATNSAAENNTYLSSHGFCGSGVLTWCSCRDPSALGLTAYSRDGSWVEFSLGGSTGAEFTSRLTQIVSIIRFLASVVLGPVDSCWLLARGSPEVLAATLWRMPRVAQCD